MPRESANAASASTAATEASAAALLPVPFAGFEDDAEGADWLAACSRRADWSTTSIAAGAAGADGALDRFAAFAGLTAAVSAGAGSALRRFGAAKRASISLLAGADADVGAESSETAAALRFLPIAEHGSTTSLQRPEAWQPWADC